MRKKVLAGMIVGMLLVGQAMSVFAAGSKGTDDSSSSDTSASTETTAAVAATDDSAATASAMDSSAIAGVAAVDKTAATVIEQFNSGAMTLADVADTLAQDDAADADVIETMQADTTVAMTDFFDLQLADGAKKNANGKYEVKLSVTIPSGYDAYLLHFSTERGVWEMVKATIDSKAGTISAELDDLSPAAVIAVPTSTSGSEGGSGNSTSTGTGTETGATSPKTGVTSAWAIWMVAAVAFAGVALVAGTRKKNEQ
ncbi:MAG: hypothetical protein LUI02_02125 [Clostridiales bacterium]|nr:hypothetical protein [Clostridiales bacterium]